MLELVKKFTGTSPRTPGDILEKVKSLADQQLPKMVADIDLKGEYPEKFLREIGKAGAFSMHLPGYSDEPPALKNAIRAMQSVGEHCLSSAFCMWCQDALGWYIFNSDNGSLKSKLGFSVASGKNLGGTALSNPMKTFFGIEKIRLSGEKVTGGYKVRGSLPWVSNLGDDHYFGAIFELSDAPGHYVMAVIDCSNKAVTLSMNNEFVALDGTRTYGIQIRDLFIPETMILADPISDYLPKIRAGFVLLQAGMAFGVIQSSIDLMKQMRAPLGHVNKYLPEQPEEFEEKLAPMQEAVSKLCETPHETDLDYWRQVIQARLLAGEVTVQAAHAAMLHCGARGYVKNGEAQRRLREAYFVAIVTPATKQLRKMLADMTH